ncbi:PucR family transcriptional regulator, partial [Streptomyces nanhaiensis]|uniref:PucR family transcriptional regulator n=1 Tax=Streptomyces nanhaiensis TaxID=679319 RepID=UPI00399CA4C3
LVLSGREAVEDRARALRLLGLEPGTPLRVIAVAADAGAGPGADTGAGRSADAGVEAVALLGRGALRGTVRVARVGSLGAVLVQRRDGASEGPGAFGGQAVPGGRGAPVSAPDGTGTGTDTGTASPAAELRAAMRERVRERNAARRPAPGTRVGIGSGADPLDAHTSWAQARSALRFAVAGAPEEAVADHDELGPLALLADIPLERLRAQADVRRLGELGEPAHGERGGPTTGQARPGGELLAALAAFCRTGSLRQAAAELHLHHSSVAARLAHVEKETGWRLRDPQDRFRAQLALYALRLAGNGDG